MGKTVFTGVQCRDWVTLFDCRTFFCVGFLYKICICVYAKFLLGKLTLLEKLYQAYIG